MAKQPVSGATGGGKSRSEAEAEELAAQVEALRKDVAAIGNTLTNLVRSTAEEGRDRLSQKASHYMDEGRRHADEAMAQARAMGEELEAQIGRNPLTAVLIALGLGFLIGVISRR
jgi:ElaB/YqjD/DUF883 family membrane-anchored ribosome-binding protein